MFRFAALIFLIIPIIEIYFLIQVSDVIGAIWTILLVVATAVIGVRLLKQQGLSTLMQAQQKMQSGTIPATEMIEGIGLIIAGAFLLTPGFFTDAVGFLLLFPLTRKAIVATFAVKIMDKVKTSMHTTTSSNNPTGQNPFDQTPNTSNSGKTGDVIEGVKYSKDPE